MNDRMKSHRERISRRTMLRGAGVVMALPWLESIPVFGADTASAMPTVKAAAAAIPKRFAALFMANGINANHWWAKGSGPSMELGKSLAPMEKLKTKMNY